MNATDVKIDFQELTKILESFGKAPEKSESDPTYFEIAGYPSLENVASNILGFFLDPSEAHGFGTLFLESLLSTVNAEYSLDEFVDVEIDREVYTDQKCRIDIVINSNSKIIGIENKLYASLNNNLNHYYSHLLGSSNGKDVIGCLLTLTPMKIPQTVKGFINLTYDKYFDEVLKNAGRKLLDLNSRYFSLFIEFIKTINRLGKEYPMSNSEFVQWLADHEQIGDKLHQEITNVKKDLTAKAKKLGSMIDLKKYIASNAPINQWIWDAFHYGEKIIAMVLVHDIQINGLRIFIDTIIRPSGYTIRISERDKKYAELKKFLKMKNLSEYIYENDGKHLPNDTELGIVREQLQDILDKIIE